MKALERLQGHLGKLNDQAVEQALLGDGAPDREAERVHLLEEASKARHDLLDTEPFW
jgi:CHAD domain-containing protein